MRVFTQNIDSLEAEAGLPEELVVAAHGNFDAALVVGTGESVPVGELKAAVAEGEAGWRRLQGEYGGLIKPSITFFGERLPARFALRAREDFAKCRLLLIFGTSLQVQPFASLVRRVPPGTPRLLVNRDPVGMDLGLRFEDDGTDGDISDVFYGGECDAGARALHRQRGWGELT